jgi:hypothetical protein
VKWVDEEAVKLSWERGREDPWPNELEARGAKVVSSRWEERRGEEEVMRWMGGAVGEEKSECMQCKQAKLAN